MDQSGWFVPNLEPHTTRPAAGRVAIEKKERNMRTINFRTSVLAAALLMPAISIAPAWAEQGRPPAGRVAYHFVARLLQRPSGTFFVIGDGNFLYGVPAPLFYRASGEKTA